VVLPPSRHKSGGHYRWAKGLSNYEIALPEVPAPILHELVNRSQERARRRHPPTVVGSGQSCSSVVVPHVGQLKNVSNETWLFVNGEYANGPNWNCRLFAAACDLAGNGVTEETATRVLLAGAKPWNAEETEHALTTIRSAFSARRSPARASKNGSRKTGSAISKKEVNDDSE
jgi:hypothetical protein